MIKVGSLVNKELFQKKSKLVLEKYFSRFRKQIKK